VNPSEDAAHRRRHRQRATPVPGPGATPERPGRTAAAGATAPVAAPAKGDPESTGRRGTPPRRRGGRDTGEHGLRDLVGAGRSQLGLSGALRGRDVDRPTEEDLTEAERDVVLVRRNWVPAPDERHAERAAGRTDSERTDSGR
jgi:hypothetical protein